jgi:catechol 2,3-dioxygenase-like lactoylglutathione lyase family enzyme
LGGRGLARGFPVRKRKQTASNPTLNGDAHRRADVSIPWRNGRLCNPVPPDAPSESLYFYDPDGNLLEFWSPNGRDAAL